MLNRWYGFILLLSLSLPSIASTVACPATVVCQQEQGYVLCTEMDPNWQISHKNTELLPVTYNFASAEISMGKNTPSCNYNYQDPSGKWHYFYLDSRNTYASFQPVSPNNWQPYIPYYIYCYADPAGCAMESLPATHH